MIIISIQSKKLKRLKVRRIFNFHILSYRILLIIKEKEKWQILILMKRYVKVVLYQDLKLIIIIKHHP